MTSSRESGPSTFTLFSTEERVLDEAERMLRQLDSVGEGVQALAKAYRRSYDEQRRLLRMSDRMQSDLHAANRRLSEQAAELQSLNAELNAVNAHKDMLFGIIAHDLRNPFSVVSGYTDYLFQYGDTLPPETLKQMAGRAHTAASTVSRLLDTLLEWSRLQTGQVQCHRQRVDLAEIVAEVVCLYENVARVKSIAVTTEVPEGTQIIADQAMTATIVRNLVNNALKFTPEQGRVAIRAQTAPDGADVVLEIADTGMGIPETALDALFKPSTGEATPGTVGEKGLGLGLPMCKELVDRQGGCLEVDSRLGVGSTFRVRFDAATEETDR